MAIPRNNTDNYALSRDRAQAWFLRFDQQALIDRWQLPYDEKRLYVRFLGQDYTIDRASGQVFRGDIRAGFSETLSIFDFLCHEGEGKYASGKLAPVNSLRGAPKTGVGTDFHREAAAVFDRDPAAFCAACRALGGRQIQLGDIGFTFPLFGELTVTLKFYRADEEFPAGITLLWEENLLQYIYYETVFYIAGYLLSRIREQLPHK